MTLSTEDIIAAIGEDQIRQALQERLKELKRQAAAQFAQMETATTPHQEQVPVNAICVCAECWAQRLSDTLDQVEKLQSRLKGSTEALVGEPIKPNRAQRRR